LSGFDLNFADYTFHVVMLATCPACLFLSHNDQPIVIKVKRTIYDVYFSVFSSRFLRGIS